MLRYLILLSFLLLSACFNGIDKTKPLVEEEIQPLYRIELTSKSNTAKDCAADIWKPELFEQKQFISIGFDGSLNNEVWKETLDYALANDVKFTFYIVGVHLLKDRNKNLYKSPNGFTGRSDVGFGGTEEELITRLEMITRAYNEGHEIASHANGHWNGSEWSFEQWNKELVQFDKFVRNAFETNEIGEHKPDNWEELVDSIVGFRAPLLGHNDEMYEALSQNRYIYDASYTGYYGKKPGIKKSGIWGFPLVSIKTKDGATLAMDYNFFYKDKQITAEKAKEKMYSAYMDFYKDNSELVNKPPMQIGHHFSRWKNGAYWNALKDFLENVCYKDEVICGVNNQLAYKLQEKYNKLCKMGELK